MLYWSNSGLLNNCFYLLLPSFLLFDLFFHLWSPMIEFIPFFEYYLDLLLGLFHLFLVFTRRSPILPWWFRETKNLLLDQLCHRLFMLNLRFQHLDLSLESASFLLFFNEIVEYLASEFLQWGTRRFWSSFALFLPYYALWLPIL